MPAGDATVPPSGTAGPLASPTEITFAYWALAPGEIAVTNELVRQFEAREPSVRVRVIEVPGHYYEKLITMFAAGTPPDVFVINHGRLGDFARRGLLMDLNPLVARSPEVNRSQFVGAAYDSFAAVGATVARPGLVALPRDWGPTNLLVFNKALFDAAGMAYANSAWTWQQFATACRRLTPGQSETATKQYGAGVCLYPYAFAGWVFQNGGDFLTPDGRQSLLADEKVVGAVQFLKGLVDEGVIAPINVGQDQSLEQFERGEVAMAFVTPYSLGELRQHPELAWGIAPPLRGTRQATGCIPTGVALSARSAHQEAAWRFLTYWVTVGAQRVAESGFCVPAWKPALRASSLERGFGPAAAAVLRSAVVYARPQPLSPTVPYEAMLADLQQALEQVFAAQVSPEEALGTAQKQINAAGSAPQ